MTLTNKQMNIIHFGVSSQLALAGRVIKEGHIWVLELNKKFFVSFTI